MQEFLLTQGYEGSAFDLDFPVLIFAVRDRSFIMTWEGGGRQIRRVNASNFSVPSYANRTKHFRLNPPISANFCPSKTRVLFRIFFVTKATCFTDTPWAFGQHFLQDLTRNLNRRIQNLNTLQNSSTLEPLSKIMPGRDLLMFWSEEYFTLTLKVYMKKHPLHSRT